MNTHHYVIILTSEHHRRPALPTFSRYFVFDANFSRGRVWVRHNAALAFESSLPGLIVVALLVLTGIVAEGVAEDGYVLEVVVAGLLEEDPQFQVVLKLYWLLQLQQGIVVGHILLVLVAFSWREGGLLDVMFQKSTFLHQVRVVEPSAGPRIKPDISASGVVDEVVDVMCDSKDEVGGDQEASAEAGSGRMLLVCFEEEGTCALMHGVLVDVSEVVEPEEVFASALFLVNEWLVVIRLHLN